jgi:hypothetical protein
LRDPFYEGESTTFSFRDNNLLNRVFGRYDLGEFWVVDDDDEFNSSG